MRILALSVGSPGVPLTTQFVDSDLNPTEVALIVCITATFYEEIWNLFYEKRTKGHSLDARWQVVSVGNKAQTNIVSTYEVE